MNTKRNNSIVLTGMRIGDDDITLTLITDEDTAEVTVDRKQLAPMAKFMDSLIKAISNFRANSAFKITIKGNS